MVNNWLNIIQNAILPPTCILCGESGSENFDLCSPCRHRLPRNLHCCYRCGENFAAPPLAPMLCGKCVDDLPAFDETYAPFLHQDEIRYLITGLKFGKQFKNARLLGGLLAEFLREVAELPDVIIPVPLHPVRYRERGFNQSIEISRTVAAKLHLPLSVDACRRIKDTPHQTGLSAKQRKQNLRRSFAVVKPVSGLHVAILDDVMTTGSTVNALSMALKKAGVAKISVWICARA